MKASDTSISRCGRCGNFTNKYPTMNNVRFGRTMSKWYFNFFCKQRHYYCSICQEFYEGRSHCRVGSLDVYVLKHARVTRVGY